MSFLWDILIILLGMIICSYGIFFAFQINDSEEKYYPCIITCSGSAIFLGLSVVGFFRALVKGNFSLPLLITCVIFLVVTVVCRIVYEII